MKILVFCVLALACTFVRARADEQPASALPPNTGSLLLRWIDARGNLYPSGKITEMKWVWSRRTDHDPIESPALRLSIASRLPKDWTPKRVTGDGITIIEPYRQDGDVQTMVVDLRSAKATLRFDFEDAQAQRSEMTLVIEAAVGRPYILVRPECGKHDLRFMVHRTQGKHLFVGLNCINYADSIDIYFFRSHDSKWNTAPGLVQFDPQNRFSAFKYHVAKPKDQVVYSQRLFRVGTTDANGTGTEYSVFYYPRVQPKLFYLSAGLGITNYSYHETTLNLPDVSLSQISSTGKVNLGIRLIPKVLDLAFNGFATAVAFTHSPSSIAEARFYGLNGRLGYRLPMDLGATEFMFLTGWYFWGMLVNPIGDDPNSVYGIKALSGPQLFLMMLNSQAGHNGWWSYFKFAMISDHLQITELGNREIAVGGGFELSAHESKPFALTLDIADARYEKADQSQGMSLLSITLGVQKPF